MFNFFDNTDPEAQNNTEDHESDKEESSRNSDGGGGGEESQENSQDGDSQHDDEEEEEEEEEKRREPIGSSKVSSKPRVSRLPTLPPLPENYPLHAAVVRKDSKALKDAINKLPPCLDPLTPFRDRPINGLDHHGYTALTLAVLTSWMEGIKILLDHGASPGVTSAEGWTSINEAVSTSQREILRMLFVANMKLMKEMLALRAPRVRKQLAQKKDFYVEIDWKFTSWIPFVSRFCPSDTFRIWKKGCDVRVDISLIDFNQFKWERGHISFIFKTTADGIVEFHILNHVEKTRQKTTKSDEIKTEEKDIDNSVEVLMQSELFCPELITNELKITHNTNWLGYPKTVEVNGIECASYTVANLIILARQRNSHVPKEVKEALKRKKNMLKEKASSNNADDNLDQLLSENEMDQENTLDNEKDKETRSRHLSTTNNAAKKSRSPVPFAGKKQQLSEYVKRYDYPKWQPPQVTIEQYFKLAKPESKNNNNNNNNLGLSQIVEEDKENDFETNNFLTNPVMASPMTSPRGGSLLSRVFGKKDKQDKQNKRKKSKNKSEKNTDADEDQEDRGDDQDQDNENENSEVSSEREWENSTSQLDNEQAEEFDEKSLYQQSTFSINRAPVRKTMKTFKLMLAISDKFGLTVDEMVTILDAAAPTSKLARKLKEFLEIKMPPGFPVQLELPIYHVLKATVTFQNFKEMEVKDDVFAIPEDYLLVEKDDVGRIEDDN